LVLVMLGSPISRRNTHPNSALYLLSQPSPTVPNHLRTPERTFLDPHIPCCSDCGSLVAVFIFFAAIEPLLNLHGEPRLLRGYDVTECIQEATHLRGAI
jgi:hypothetical protein